MTVTFTNPPFDWGRVRTIRRQEERKRTRILLFDETGRVLDIARFDGVGHAKAAEDAHSELLQAILDEGGTIDSTSSDSDPIMSVEGL